MAHCTPTYNQIREYVHSRVKNILVSFQYDIIVCIPIEKLKGI